MDRIIRAAERTLLMLAAVLTALLIFGRPQATYAAGSGTAADPYLVNSWDDLSTKMSGGGHIKLTADVANGQELIVPSGKTVHLDLNGHVINRGLTGSQGESEGGVICVNGTLDLTDSSPNASHNGGFKYTMPGSNVEVEVTGGIITGGYTRTGGGGIYITGTLNMYGGSVIQNKSENIGGGVFVGSATGRFNMYGGSIIANSSVARGSTGGGVQSRGTFVMYGGSIEANTAYVIGGGVYNTGTFTMYGGIIKGNQTTNASPLVDGGGGVFNYGNFKMYGGSIKGNQAKESGGGLTTPGIFEFWGGVIENNSAPNGGGIYIYSWQGGSAGSAQILGGVLGNNTAENGANLYYEDDTQFQWSSGTIKTTSKDSSHITGNVTVQSVKDGLGIYKNGSIPDSVMVPTGAYISKPISQIGTTRGTSYYQLTQDIVLSEPLVVEGEPVVLDLNGYSIKGAADKETIRLDGSKLTITDSRPEAGHNESMGYKDPDGKSVTVTGGIITHASGAHGRGITCNKGNLTMYGGTVCNNVVSSGDGGGVYIVSDNYDKELMLSGSAAICGNRVEGGKEKPALSGGGIAFFAESGYTGIFSMEGLCTVSDNLVVSGTKALGGGICLGSPISMEVSGNIQIKGNKIKENNVTSDGNLYLPAYNGQQQKIGISGSLSSSSGIGITLEKPARPIEPATFTDGLGGKGEISSFISDKEGFLILKTGTGEAELSKIFAFITQPEDLSLDAGATSGNVLTVDTESMIDSPVTYQWYSCKDENKTGSTLVYEKADSSYDTSSYTVPTGKIGTFYYYCKVSIHLDSSTISGESRVARVNVVGRKPTLTVTGPSDLKLKEGYKSGNVLSVSAKVSAGFGLSYQWYSCKDSSGKGAAAVSGATKASYTIPKGKGAGTLYYYCAVTATGTAYGNSKTQKSRIAKVTISSVSRPIKSITLNKSTLTLECGQTFTLKPTIMPKNASNKNLNWTSSNTKAAAVSKTGVVTAKGGGTAIITAKAADGSKKKVTCKVKVKEYKDIKRVYVLPANLTMKKGNSRTLRVVIMPSNAKNKRINWKSSNAKIVAVTAAGKVTAKKKGTAYITVTTADGKKSKKIRITVA